MVERADQTALAVHFQVTGGPCGRGADITGENRILCRQLADQTVQVLRVDDVAVGAAFSQGVEVLTRFFIIFEG